MPAPVTEGELRVQLSRLTGMSEAEWSDFFSLPEKAQVVAVQNYRDASWVQAPDKFAAVLVVLNVLVTIAGAVSGISGAISAVSALRAL